MSQTFCKMEVFPAFALPMMSTLNLIFGTRGGCGGAGDSAGEGAEGAEDSAGDGGDGAGADVGLGIGASAGARAGVSSEAGARCRDGTKQQILCFIPIVRKCCEKKDWVACVDHSSESVSSLLYTQYMPWGPLSDIRNRFGSLTVLASLEIPFWARLRPAWAR